MCLPPVTFYVGAEYVTTLDREPNPLQSMEPFQPPRLQWLSHHARKGGRLLAGYQRTGGLDGTDASTGSRLLCWLSAQVAETIYECYWLPTAPPRLPPCPRSSPPPPSPPMLGGGAAADPIVVPSLPYLSNTMNLKIAPENGAPADCRYMSPQVPGYAFK